MLLLFSILVIIRVQQILEPIGLAHYTTVENAFMTTVGSHGNRLLAKCLNVHNNMIGFEERCIAWNSKSFTSLYIIRFSSMRAPKRTLK